MFTTFFKMTALPFTEIVSINQIFKDDRISQGLARLQYLTLQGTIALITGLTGIGKSVLIKLFLSNLPKNHYKTLYIHFTNIKASSLFKLIATELGETPKLAKERVFLQIIDKVSKINQAVLLIIDEAHLLDTDSITNLRLLVSSALQEAPPVKIILAGQDDIKKKLKHSSLADFDNRISLKFHLPPLSKAQSIAYIDFQLNYSGASHKIFDSDVKEMIHEFSNGVPRLINNISTACLINASIHKVQKIDSHLLNQTMAEFLLF